MNFIILVANFLMFFAFILKFTKLPPQLPLFYSRPWGEFQITDRWFIFLLPIFMNGLFFLNLFLYKKLFAQDTFAPNLFKYLNLFIVVSFTFIFIKIIFLVT